MALIGIVVLKILDLFVPHHEHEAHHNHSHKTEKCHDEHLYHIGIVSIDAKCIELPKIYEHTVEVIGDSTIAGFGNLGKVEDSCTTTNTDGLLDYTFKALKELKSEVHTFCASGWGVFGSIWTTPKDIKITDFKDKVCVFSDIPWDYNKINPELIIISLGTNDYYYIQEIEELKEQRRMSFIKEYVDFINYKLAC